MDLEYGGLEMDFMAPQGFVHSLYNVLRLRRGASLTLAPVCSSWVWVCFACTSSKCFFVSTKLGILPKRFRESSSHLYPIWYIYIHTRHLLILKWSLNRNSWNLLQPLGSLSPFNSGHAALRRDLHQDLLVNPRQHPWIKAIKWWHDVLYYW